MIYFTLKLKVIPMKFTGDGKPSHTLNPQFPLYLLFQAQEYLIDFLKLKIVTDLKLPKS
jgi:hypothetical protein